MLRASSLLRNRRLEKQLEITDISKKTKIPSRHLLSLENEDFSCFPPEPYCSLIIKSYAQFLGIDDQEILKLFRRDFDQRRKSSSLQSSRLRFTPSLVFNLFIFISIAVFATFLGSEFIKYHRPPALKVNWPPSPSDNTLELSGLTDSEATVRINDNLIIVDSEGKFQKKIALPSNAKIVVEAKSPSGKVARQEKTYPSP